MPKSPLPSARVWTLTRRIACLALAPVALVAAGGGLWLRGQIHSTVYQGFAQHLHEESESLAARLRVDAGRVVEEANNQGQFGVIYSGWYWQADGTAASGHSRSLWDAAPLTPAPAPAVQALLQATGPMGESLLGLRRHAIIPGSAAPVPLTVFAPAGELHSNLQRIDRILLASTAVLMAALTVMLLVQLRVGLAPLRRLTGAIAAQREGVPGGSVALDALALGSDLAPLQRELGALLAHNASVVARARAHAADLNHALKKPLALLSAAASRQQAIPAAEVLHQVGEMTGLIDRYQARTLGDSRPHSATRAAAAVPVAECLAQLLQAMRKLHAAQDLVWQLELPPDAARWRWRGERTDLEEALGNLLDNAGKWAASRVRVSAQRAIPQTTAGAAAARRQRHNGTPLAISIEDDGPGMSAAQLAAAGQRGLRFDENVQGSGLGLAIAGQIATAWNAQLHLGKSEALKGLRATLTLPGVWLAAT